MLNLISDNLPAESLIEFIAVAIAIATIIMMWKFRKQPEVKYMIFVEFLAGIWSFTYGMEFLTPTLESKVLWSKLSYFGVAFLPVIYFLFTLAFIQKYKIITARNVSLLSIIPFLTLILVMTNGYHHLVWKNVTLDPARNMITYGRGIWFWLFWAYSLAMIFGGMYNLIRSVYEFTSYYKSQVSTLLIATIVPLAGNIMYVTNLNPVPGLDWTPVLFIFTGLVINFGIVRYRMFDLVPSAKNKLVETMSDGVVVINSEGFIEDYNPAVDTIFNLNGKSYLRKHFSEIFKPHSNFLSALKSEEKNPVEIKITAKGKSNFYQIRILKIYERNQKFSGHLLQINDISLLKEAENNLKEANAKLQAEVEERGRLISDLDAFAHTVAHDLNNSLGNIYSSSEVIREYIDSGDAKMLDEMAVLVKAAAQKAMKITNELLILSTISHQEITGKPLDMKYIFSGAKNQVNDMVKKSSATITEPETWPEAMGYDAWIEEVWVNLLTNAVKYGGTPPEIRVGAEVNSNNSVKFWIQDNGIGITPENQNKLFKKYSRLAPEKADGYGLGLSIVKRIVEKLHGTVGVESSGIKGQGSLFWFQLPAKQPDREN